MALRGGDIQIPDSVKNGHYWLVAYTDDVYRSAQPVYSEAIIVNNRPIGFDQIEFPRSSSTVGVSIKTDTTVFKAGQPVTLSIRLTDSSGAPIRGMFSLSVAAAGKVAGSDIAIYQVDTSLLIKNPGSNIDPDYGYILNKGNQPKEAVSLAIMGTNVIKFTSGPSGQFELPFQLLKGPYGASLLLTVTEQNSDEYSIVVHHSTDSLDSVLTHLHYSDDLPARTLVDTNATGAIVSTGSMPAAVVKARFNDDDDPGNTKGDCSRDMVYVAPGQCGKAGAPAATGCKFLNWKNPERHQYTTEKNLWRDSPMFILVVTGGSRPTEMARLFITVRLQLFPSSWSRLILLRNPGHSFPLPTLTGRPCFGFHWLRRHVTAVVRLSFTTGNVGGRYVCTLQGISQAGPIYGQSFFEVTH